MMKPVTGQYECAHRSGVGLDYFMSRLDRLTLYPNGRFVLIVQERSRAMNAAQSLMSGQQASATAPEVRREGNYIVQGITITFSFDDGARLQGQLSQVGNPVGNPVGNGGLQIGPDLFNKVSDSTMLPPTHRLQKDMDDIAKGLKIAGTIGSIAMKAAKTIQETIQSTQAAQSPQTPPQSMGQSNQAPPQAPGQPGQMPQQPAPAAQGTVETLYCDQCGARARPGKKFCNNCGARLP